MLYSTNPTFVSSVSKFIQNNKNSDHSALIQKFNKLVFENRLEVLENTYFDPILQYSLCDNKDGFFTDYSVRSENPQAGIFLCLLASLLQTCRDNPPAMIVLAILIKHIDTSHKVSIDHNAFHEIVSVCSTYQVPNIFKFFEALAFIKLEFTPLYFDEAAGNIVTSPTITESLFTKFETASHDQIYKSLEFGSFKGEIISAEFNPVLHVLLNDTFGAVNERRLHTPSSMGFYEFNSIS